MVDERTTSTDLSPRGVIFDGDDTLWLTEELYDDARQLARAVVVEAGLDGAAWEAAQRRRDLENVAVHGLNPDRFPTSCVEAFESIGGQALPNWNAWAARVRSAAETVFATPARVRHGAVELMSELAARGILVALLTKGDAEVQRRRISDSGLADWFAVTVIVDHKSAADFVDVSNRLGLPPALLLSVGNSIQSDILPSEAAGVRALWIPAHVWDYEQRHDPALERHLTRVDSLLSVLNWVSE